MRVLVDTHPLIWALEADPRLSKRATQILTSDNTTNYPQTMKVSAQYAEEHFADILVTAKSGEDVVIGCPDDSSFRLTLMPAVSKPAAPRPRRDLLGAGEGMITLPSDEDWKTMDNEFAAEILNRPIFPPEQ